MRNRRELPEPHTMVDSAQEVQKKNGPFWTPIAGAVRKTFGIIIMKLIDIGSFVKPSWTMQ
jgi:hypothetical protein